jgi:hypothetical protein
MGDQAFDAQPACRARSPELRSIGTALGERRMWTSRCAMPRTTPATPAESRNDASAQTPACGARFAAGVCANSRRSAPDGAGDSRRDAGAAAPWLQGYEWELAYRLQQLPREPKARHELRIQAKKVRYVLECLGRRSPSLEKLQDHLDASTTSAWCATSSVRNEALRATNARRERAQIA